MNQRIVSSWAVQSAVGVGLVAALSLGLGGWSPSAQEAAPKGVAASGDRCAEGYYGSPETGCLDVNECASANGGCHKLASCKNTPGSRVCGSCPDDFAGSGYVGCFDVNECPNGDCSDRIPSEADVAAAEPPAVTTSGDATVAAVSEAGAPATFTATATDSKDGVRQAYCLPRSGSTFKVGTTTVSCWATNSRGKIGRATLSVTVTKPTF